MKNKHQILAPLALLCAPLLPVIALTSCGSSSSSSGGSTTSSISTEELAELLNNPELQNQFTLNPLTVNATDSTSKYKVADGTEMIALEDITANTENISLYCRLAKFDSEGEIIPNAYEKFFTVADYTNNGFNINHSFLSSSPQTGDMNISVKLYFKYVKNGESAGFELDSAMSTYTFNGVTFTFQPEQVISVHSNLPID